MWLAAEAGHAKFGHEVPAVDVDEDEKFKSVREKGIWTPKPDEEIYVARAAKGELDAWRRANSGGGELRLIGNFRDGAGRRNVEFRRAVELMTQTAFDDFTHDGERAMKEFLDAVVNGAGTFTSYHSEWVRASGVSDSSAIAHEHRVLFEAVRLGSVYDQYNLANSAMGEQIVRRIIQHEMAVARDSRHPDYTGLSLIMGGTVSETGAAVTSKFHNWAANRQRDQATVLKQGRLLREEKAEIHKKAKGKGKGKKEETGADAVPEHRVEKEPVPAVDLHRGDGRTRRPPRRVGGRAAGHRDLAAGFWTR